MQKTLFVLSLLAGFVVSVTAQSLENVTFKVSVVDNELNLRSVPKFALVIRGLGPTASTEVRVTTATDGVAVAQLGPGFYTLASEQPLVFQNRTFVWSTTFSAERSGVNRIELSSDNAKISSIVGAKSDRDVTRGGEMFKDLRNGVVTVQSELEPGTGFIIDGAGLIITNHHVIDQSNDIRVRFDKKTAVKARVLAVDEERDLAILQVNLSVFPDARVLEVARSNSGEPPVLEGERVFSIGSPLFDEKILASGTASKIESGAILTDITFNPSNSGAPLFNSLGAVVGISAFKIKDRSGAMFAKNETVAGDSGLSGIIAIDQALDLIAKAKAIAATKGQPSTELMPNLPNGQFPIDSIKVALRDKNFPLKQYVSDVKDYQIKYMTPTYKFYVMEKDRIESLKIRNERNKNKGVVDGADPFRDLRYWSEYASELRPLVQILALPETGASGASLALSVLSQGVVGYGTPLNHKYKADFYQMKLMCDGTEIIPLIRNKTEIVRDLQNYYKEKKRFSYAGVYSYPYESFAPGQCKQMQVQIFSEEDLEKPITSDVTDATKARIWADFQDFRTKTAAGPAPAKSVVTQ